MNLRQYAAQIAAQPPETQQEPPCPQEGTLPLLREQAAERDAQARALEDHRQYSENRAKSGQLQAEILQGLKAGENPYELLCKAAECIGLMTGEAGVFAGAVKGYIRDVYGYGIGDPRAVEVELTEVRQRLAMMQRPELEQTQQLQTAIEAHRRREADLITLQATGRPYE